MPNGIAIYNYVKASKLPRIGGMIIAESNAEFDWGIFWLPQVYTDTKSRVKDVLAVELVVEGDFFNGSLQLWILVTSHGDRIHQTVACWSIRRGDLMKTTML